MDPYWALHWAQARLSGKIGNCISFVLWGVFLMFKESEPTNYRSIVNGEQLQQNQGCYPLPGFALFVYYYWY